MVVTEDSAQAFLLRGHRGQCLSDDLGNVEVVFDNETMHIRDPFETSAARRSRILNKLRQKVAKTVRYIGTKPSTRSDVYGRVENENITAPSFALKANRSQYDQGNILERRDGPPSDDKEQCDTFSTVSSDFSTSSNLKRQRRLITHWKSCMGLSVRKLLRKEIENDMKGNPPKYHDFGLHISAQDAVFTLSKDRKKSAFHLLVPSLDTPLGSNDEASDACHYDNAIDFPLQPVDEIAFEVAMQQSDDDQMQVKDLSTLLPRKSNLYVSFEQDMAQIIFQTASSETDDFQAVDVHSVESDMEAISLDDDPFAITYPTSDNFGTAPSNSSSDFHERSTTNLNPRKPDLPEVMTNDDYNVDNNTVAILSSYQRRQEEMEVWSRVDCSYPDDELSGDPPPLPPPTFIETSREEFWGLGQMDSRTNTYNATVVDDAILKSRAMYSPAILDIPFPQDLLGDVGVDDYPYDEDDVGMEYETTNFTTKSAFEFGEVLPFAPESNENHPPRSDSQRNRGSVDKAKCGCVKCTAKSILYQELMYFKVGSRVRNNTWNTDEQV